MCVLGLFDASPRAKSPKAGPRTLKQSSIVKICSTSLFEITLISPSTLLEDHSYWLSNIEVPCPKRMLSQRKNGFGAIDAQSSGRPVWQKSLKLDLLIDVVMLVGSTWYTIVALGYPSGAGRVPAAVSAVVVFIAIFRVIFDIRKLMMIKPWRRYPDAESQGQDSRLLSETPGLPEGVSAGNQGSPHDASLGDLVRQGSVATIEAPEYAEESQMNGLRHSVGWRELMSLGWLLIFLASTILFGFRIGIPLAGGIYSLVGVRWPKTWQRAVFVVATVVVLYILILAFVDTLHYSFSGII